MDWLQLYIIIGLCVSYRVILINFNVNPAWYVILIALLCGVFWPSEIFELIAKNNRLASKND